jgi:hypothetical protein
MKLQRRSLVLFITLLFLFGCFFAIEMASVAQDPFVYPNKG